MNLEDYLIVGSHYARAQNYIEVVHLFVEQKKLSYF